MESLVQKYQPVMKTFTSILMFFFCAVVHSSVVVVRHLKDDVYDKTAVTANTDVTNNHYTCDEPSTFMSAAQGRQVSKCLTTSDIGCNKNTNDAHIYLFDENTSNLTLFRDVSVKCNLKLSIWNMDEAGQGYWSHLRHVEHHDDQMLLLLLRDLSVWSGHLLMFTTSSPCTECVVVKISGSRMYPFQLHRFIEKLGNDFWGNYPALTKSGVDEIKAGKLSKEAYTNVETSKVLSVYEAGSKFLGRGVKSKAGRFSEGDVLGTLNRVKSNGGNVRIKTSTKFAPSFKQRLPTKELSPNKETAPEVNEVKTRKENTVKPTTISTASVIKQTSRKNNYSMNGFSAGYISKTSHFVATHVIILIVISIVFAVVSALFVVVIVRKKQKALGVDERCPRTEQGEGDMAFYTPLDIPVLMSYQPIITYPQLSPDESNITAY